MPPVCSAPLSLYRVRSDSHDPWLNLAVEERLMEHVGNGTGLPAGFLYLWQNDRTVVIGRHQNAWAECRAALLEQEGGKLARRGSGGGAVYHDLGNLNFSIVLPRVLHDPSRSSGMVVEAVRSLGIDAALSGRNDILAGDRKFSGNAFQLTGSAGLHHGTLLVSTDFGQVARYLSVSKAKLDSKGVSSVQSRITNLNTIAPDVTVERAGDALIQAFCRHYGTEAGIHASEPQELDFRSLVDAACLAYRDRHASWTWRFGRSLPFEASLEQRFDWGSVRLEFHLENGHVQHHALFTDMLDPDFPAILDGLFDGCRFDPADLAGRLDLPLPEADGPYGVSRAGMLKDIQGMIRDQLS